MKLSLYWLHAVAVFVPADSMLLNSISPIAASATDSNMAGPEFAFSSTPDYQRGATGYRTLPCHTNRTFGTVSVAFSAI